VIETVMALPDHLRDALWRVESARLEPYEAEGLICCGMGGSGIGGELARAAIGDRLAKPLETARTYSLPPTAAATHLILCSSYSGATEETLSCYDAAERLGAPRIVATTGGALEGQARGDSMPVIGLPSGMQPRAAVGYMFVVAAEAARLAGAGPDLRQEIEGAADHLVERRDALAQRAADLAKDFGAGAMVVYGCDLTAPVAYRWKTQLNENAKLPAFSHELPEADHNELEGWAGADAALSLGAIFLLDADQSARERQRFELTAELVGERARATELVEPEGETRTARLFEAVMLGDLFSLHVAQQRGVDPAPVETIERFKKLLSGLVR
jgi:glucose/mannose-6-phosphate isomerase